MFKERQGTSSRCTKGKSDETAGVCPNNRFQAEKEALCEINMTGLGSLLTVSEQYCTQTLVRRFCIQIHHSPKRLRPTEPTNGPSHSSLSNFYLVYENKENVKAVILFIVITIIHD